MTCGAMTSTPGLGATSSQFDSDVPALSYAAVYPLALVAMTVVAQIMATALR
jgi:putative transport protein